jgi:hypothetical protein
MDRGYLATFFVKVAIKKLQTVDLPGGSNQHEFGRVSKLREILGDQKRTFDATFIYIMDDDEPTCDRGTLTWYDSRAGKAGRSAEYRLYYTDNAAILQASVGDLLIIAHRTDGSFMVIVAENGSTAEQQLLWLFNASDDQLLTFSVKGDIESNHLKFEFLIDHILRMIGIESSLSDDTYLDEMLHRFDGGVPSASALSAFARETMDRVDLHSDADTALMTWMQREEVLFRTLQNHLLCNDLRGSRSSAGANGMADLATTVFESRISWFASALDNHVVHLLRMAGLSFSRFPPPADAWPQGLLFPSEQAPLFKLDRATMLVIRPSGRDWSDVTDVEDSSLRRYLLTLEPSIAVAQTDQMCRQGLSLVVPKMLHSSYRPVQADNLIGVEEFVDLVRRRELSLRT